MTYYRVQFQQPQTGRWWDYYSNLTYPSLRAAQSTRRKAQSANSKDTFRILKVTEQVVP